MVNKKDRMCPYYSKYRGSKSWEHYGGYLTHEVVYFRGRHRTRMIRRKRIKCPECGRKMWARKAICSDGCCISYVVPPHKKKGWWKKPKKG